MLRQRPNHIKLNVGLFALEWRIVFCAYIKSLFVVFNLLALAMSRNQEHGTIFEFISIGSYVKVSAIDTRSGTEVSIVGDPRRGEVALRRIALRKLEKKLGKPEQPRSRGRLV
jgi:hypothetical protein